MDDGIETQINSLKGEYAAIATKACSCLEARNQSAVLTAVWLNEILRGTKDEPLIVGEKVTNYSDLFLQLQTKWSFTNPDFLEQLLEILGNDSLIKKLAEYRQKFNKVCSEFPIDRAVRFEPYDPNQACLVLILNFRTFHDIQVILKDVFDIYARYLRVHMVRPGSIKKVTVQFPAVMERLIQPLVTENEYTDTTQTSEPLTGDTDPAAAIQEDQTSEAICRAKH